MLSQRFLLFIFIILAISCSTQSPVSDTSEETRDPAEYIAVRSESENSYNNMNPSVSYYQPQAVTSSRRDRERRQREYYQQPNPFFRQFYQPRETGTDIGLPPDPYNEKFGTVTPQNANNCGGLAYIQLKRTIGSCGCQVANACARSQNHRNAGLSCHRVGAAVDVMAVTCDGYPYAVKPYINLGRKLTPWEKWLNQRYWNFVACESKFFERVIWQKEDHYDHAHFAYECRVNGYIKW